MAAEQAAFSQTTQERSLPMLYTILIVLLVLFVLGFLR